MIVCLCRETARGLLAHERLRRDPLVDSLGLGQLNCRRLWGRDGSVHDGFMGLVGCLDQLGLQVPCAQETQSPLMSSLPMDQPFRYDGPDGSHGREAGFLLHSSLPLGPLTHSPFAGVSSRALFVSAHNMRHMLALPLTLALAHACSLSPSRLAAPLRRTASSVDMCSGTSIVFFQGEFNS